MRRTPYWRGAITLVACAAALAVPIIFSQAPTPAGTEFQLKAFGTHRAMTAASPYKALSWQSIGPVQQHRAPDFDRRSRR